MGVMVLSLVMFIGLIVLLLFGSPIAYTLGFIATLWLKIGELPATIIPQRMFSGMSQFTLMAVPFFVLAGKIMNSSGITDELVSFINYLVGRFRGGLAQANILTSLVFAGITGAAISDVAALGSIFIPIMEKNGYERKFAAAVTAASSLVGPIIPPSIIIVLYSAVTGVSIGSMFMAAILPGVTIGISQMILTYFISEKRNYPRYEVESFSLKGLLKTMVKTALAIIMPLIIVGGIVFGFFTPTEAAAIAVLYALILGKFVFKKINLKVFLDNVQDSVRTTVMLLFIIAMAMILSWVLSYINLPVIMANYLIGLIGNKWLVFLFVVMILLFVGTWLESGAACIMLAPIFSEMLLVLGFHPLHAGTVMIIVMNVGLITPPLGVCLFAASSVSGEKFENIVREILPYLAIIFIAVLILVFVPQISLFLPRLFNLM
ncbi:MAG: TRAP transporter large permease [Firmicutes bacterium]|nr:TRAP transporter large permease [Bacillota bacterium]